MSDDPNAGNGRMTAREALVFWLKLACYLAALCLFGAVIYWLRRRMG